MSDTNDPPTPRATADGVVSDVVSGHMIVTTCPHCHQALDLLISDDGRLLHLGATDGRAHLTPEPDEPDE